MEEISNRKAKELKNTLTDVELKQIQAQREFQSLKPNSPRFKVGVANDVFARNIRTHKSNIEKGLWTIKNIENQQFKLKLQKKSGKITQELSEGVIMTPEELSLEIEHKDWVMEKERHNILTELWQLAQYVGQHNVLKQVILSEEEFDQFHYYVESSLHDLSLKLYD
jgi:hypothetical protein